MIQKLNVSTYEHQSGTETSGKIHWLLSLKGMLIKKVPGECYQHSPGRYDALASPLLRGYATCFKPSPGASRTGAFVLAYSRDEARSIRQRSVSSAKSTRRLMRLTSLTRETGVCAVPNAWEEAT